MTDASNDVSARSLRLNERAMVGVESLLSHSGIVRIKSSLVADACVLDVGSKALGGFEAGLSLARICLANLASVSIEPGDLAGRPCPYLQVWTDHPVAACLASQYAGWQISEGKFFAMGSGPMRASAGKETLFETIGYREQSSQVVGVLECRKTPTEEVVAKIAGACGVQPSGVSLLFAPTASLAGTIQIVARSVETALHKLAELKFDLTRIVSGHGVAPVPPVAKDDLAAIGRTNDSILYGARVVLYVTGDDDSLASLGPKVPSACSADHGAPFAEIFSRYNHDFYAVDPHLFSPAQIEFQNIETGKTHTFGRLEPGVLARSFFE